MGAIPDDKGYWVCNTVWLLDDFTPENGATRMVPGSHRWRTRPQDVLADPLAAHPDEILLTGAAGSVAVMNAHMWHGGTANTTAAPRLAMHGFYCRRDKPQQQYQKRLLRPEVQAGLSAEARRILALDDPSTTSSARGTASAAASSNDSRARLSRKCNIRRPRVSVEWWCKTPVPRLSTTLRRPKSRHGGVYEACDSLHDLSAGVRGDGFGPGGFPGLQTW